MKFEIYCKDCGKLITDRIEIESFLFEGKYTNLPGCKHYKTKNKTINYQLGYEEGEKKGYNKGFGEGYAKAKTMGNVLFEE